MRDSLFFYVPFVLYVPFVALFVANNTKVVLKVTFIAGFDARSDGLELGLLFTKGDGLCKSYFLRFQPGGPESVCCCCGCWLALRQLLKS